MYLVSLVFQFRGRRPGVPELENALLASVAGSDHLEHWYIDSGDAEIGICFFLKATDGGESQLLGEQLGRRLMASLPHVYEWSIASIRTW